MGRIIGRILGAILAIWIAVMAADGIFATFKTFLIVGLIAMAVFIVVWLVAGRSRRVPLRHPILRAHEYTIGPRPGEFDFRGRIFHRHAEAMQRVQRIRREEAGRTLRVRAVDLKLCQKVWDARQVEGQQAQDE